MSLCPALFGVTAPNGKFAIFHQLGSTLDRVCIEKCLEKINGNGLFLGGSFTFSKGEYLVFQNRNTEGSIYLRDSEGKVNWKAEYKIERIFHTDPRYKESACIKAFSEFFGEEVVDDVMNPKPQPVPAPVPSSSTQPKRVPIYDKNGEIVGFQEI